jgi:signal transduction histidine kinase
VRLDEPLARLTERAEWYGGRLAVQDLPDGVRISLTVPV